MRMGGSRDIKIHLCLLNINSRKLLLRPCERPGSRVGVLAPIHRYHFYSGCLGVVFRMLKMWDSGLPTGIGVTYDLYHCCRCWHFVFLSFQFRGCDRPEFECI